MIDSLVASISAAFSRPSAPAFGAAALWGLLSVLLSPCHLGSIPLIVAYINNGERPDRRRAFGYSFIFAIGLLVMLAIIGVATSLAGRILGDIGPAARISVAIFLILCGLWLMDIPPLSRLTPSFSVKQGVRRGPLGALVLGLVYGVVLGPCSFAFLAPMLGFVFAAGTAEVAYGASLMALYAVGHTTAIVAAGGLGDFVGAMLRKRGTGLAAVWFKRLMGAIVAVAGIAQLL
ncbi:MAG TPA: cytochrome c biogenesis protein CcdA [Spirochaetales bacterium]|nr:cytochrome c biogenesis protein CcdA [Spirochaetales bacterium]HRZ65456.1 cytochrome c biogenesis protein CcdA [Spirochaetia bacterium]